MPRPTLHDVLDLLQKSVDPRDLKRSVDPDDDVWSSKELTRTAFFREAHWAILVAGMRFATAQEWFRKADECGFPFDWRSLAAWSDDEFESWCKRMASKLAKPQDDLAGGFRKRWRGIHDLGRYLAEFASDAEFRERCFNGKEQGNELNDDDFHTLLRIKRRTGRFYGIGPASVWFIMRNLGGNFLKPDTWIKAFAAWYGNDVPQLAHELKEAGIHRGEFDAYLWVYCTQSEISNAKNLAVHFDSLFNP